MALDLALARRYKYMIIELSEDGDVGYEAIIPKFPNICIMADTPNEIHKFVIEDIAEMIEEYKKDGIPIPPPDFFPNKKYSGKFVLRIEPDLHESIVYTAHSEGKTLNQFLNELIKEKITPKNRQPDRRTSKK